jgi:hypothetical protein
VARSDTDPGVRGCLTSADHSPWRRFTVAADQETPPS